MGRGEIPRVIHREVDDLVAFLREKLAEVEHVGRIPAASEMKSLDHQHPQGNSSSSGRVSMRPAGRPDSECNPNSTLISKKMRAGAPRPGEVKPLDWRALFYYKNLIPPVFTDLIGGLS